MPDISVRFWGVRGSVPSPGPATVRYGGNTACVEVRCGDHLLVFDAGTGLRALGNSFGRRGVHADVFLSHYHTDHIAGLPFFAPCYHAESRIGLWAGNLLLRPVAQVARTIMSDPLFPNGSTVFKASLEFHDFRTGEALRPHPGITLRTAPLNHPGGSTGYRVEYANRSIAYITDTEHRPGALDEKIVALAKGADLMIYDGNYTDEEFPDRIGWGHSTWQEGLRILEAAGGKRLAIFHHDPDHDDAFLDRVGVEASVRRAGTVVASEGMTLAL